MFTLSGPKDTLPWWALLGLACLVLSGWMSPCHAGLPFASPAPGSEPGPGSFSFVVIGDNRPQGIYRPQPEVFDAILRRINEYRPDFVVGTGDYVYGRTFLARDTRRQYLDFCEKLKILSCPFYGCPGNHDLSGRKGDKYFKTYIGKLYRSFRYGGSLFIMLNTEESGAGKNIAGSQLEWLERRLSSSARRGDAHRFVFMHYPMFIPDLRTRKKHRRPPSGRDALHRLFVRHRVDMVFAGHEHYYHREVVDGIAYVICAGAGAPLYADAGEGGFYHFVRVRVDGDRVIDEVVRLDQARWGNETSWQREENRSWQGYITTKTRIWRSSRGPRSGSLAMGTRAGPRP